MVSYIKCKQMRFVATNSTSDQFAYMHEFYIAFNVHITF